MEGQGTWGLGCGTKDRRQPAWNRSPLGAQPPRRSCRAQQWGWGGMGGWPILAAASFRPPAPHYDGRRPASGASRELCPQVGGSLWTPSRSLLGPPHMPQALVHSAPPLRLSVSEAGAKCTSSRARGASCPDSTGMGVAPGRVEPRGQASKSCRQPGLPPPALSRWAPQGPESPAPKSRQQCASPHRSLPCPGGVSTLRARPAQLLTCAPDSGEQFAEPGPNARETDPPQPARVP